MGIYKSKPFLIEALTWEEFIEYGLNCPNANINDGIPWSFEYKGLAVTQEKDDLYLIESDSKPNGLDKFRPTDMLVTGKYGNVFVLSKEQFDGHYELDEDNN